MAKKDIYHDAVRNALIKDGWTITHDPLYLPFGRRKVYIDLGADAPIGAEREGKKIAVEIKSFVGASEMEELEKTLGQLLIYQFVLAEEEPDRVLYLALSTRTYTEIFDDNASRQLLARTGFKVIVFDAEEEVIEQWIE